MNCITQYKKLNILFYFSSLYLLFSCGTTGKIAFYDYQVSKDTLQTCINNFLTKNENYVFPINDSAWINYTPQDSVISYELIEDHLVYKNLKCSEVYIYFKEKPEEVYRLSYYMDEKYWMNHPNYSRLVLVSIVKKGKKWRYSDPIFNSFFRGRKRVEKRLELEVLNKLQCKYLKVN